MKSFRNFLLTLQGILLTSVARAQETAESAAETAGEVAAAEGFDFSKFVKQDSDAPQSLTELAEDQWNTMTEIVNTIIEFCVNYSFQVVGGLIVLGIGWFVAGIISKNIEKALVKNKVDVTLSKFMAGGIRIAIIGFACVVALEKFGIQITPLIAGLSVLGVGVGLAMQGALSNYAAGIALIFTKPFKVGEIIQVAGETGTITDIKLPRTELRTVDGELVIIPNKHIIGEIVHNYSEKKRLDITVGVSYSSDMDLAINTVKGVVENSEYTIKTKSPKIGISEFADSSVNIYARLWVQPEKYWDAMFSINRSIFAALKENNIEIPFPQRDVHIKKED